MVSRITTTRTMSSSTFTAGDFQNFFKDVPSVSTVTVREEAGDRFSAGSTTITVIINENNQKD